MPHVGVLFCAEVPLGILKHGGGFAPIGPHLVVNIHALRLVSAPLGHAFLVTAPNEFKVLTFFIGVFRSVPVMILTVPSDDGVCAIRSPV